MRKKELMKRLWAMGMAATMAVTSSGLVALADEKQPEATEEVTLEKKVADENSTSAVNFEEEETELYCGTDWSGSNATVKADKTKAVLEVSNFGWNGEWGLQYIIKSLSLKDNTTYKVEFDITSTADKKFFLKLDDAGGFIAEPVELNANETKHYVKTVNCGSFCDKPYLFFALGQMAPEEANRSGEVTIEGLKFTEVTGSDTGDDSGSNTGNKEKGPEYDFTKDNSQFDYADTGLTKSGYDLIWSDEFDGNYGDDRIDENTGLNLDNWSYQMGDGSTDCGNYGWGNNELQCYTNRPENVGVNEDLNGDGKGNGVLRITAKREDGYAYKTESAKNYTSARLRTTSPTEALFDTTYGYVEARIALPATAGAWPAFWMLPESTSVYGNWPVSGEIDILETCGAFTDKGNNVACGTLHWGTPTHVYKGSGYVELDSDYTYFHTYAIDWEPGQITWYYDGKPINTLTNWESAIPGASDSLSFDAPFDMPFYMLLNLAVDSGQFGGGVNKAEFKDDINMYVDYVRVFQKTEGYKDSVTRKAAEGTSDNWKDFAGVNQISELTTDSLKVCEGGGMSDTNADKSNWYLSYQQDATDATLDKYVDSDGKNWAKVGIKSPGAQDYSVQLIGHYDAKSGYVYKVSYDAYANGGMVGKSVNCDSKEWKGWSTYGVTQFKLEKEPTHYSYTFQQTEDFDNCRIEFNLGAQNSGDVYISNVKVEIVDPEIIGNTEKARTPLSDGNMVYNGSFDQGDNHLGYWSSLGNTKTVVPRYTTEALKSDDLMVVDIASKSNYENIPDGNKFFERRAQIEAIDNNSPTIYQPEMKITKDKYTVKFDLYSKEDTAVQVGAYTLIENEGEITLGKKLGVATTKYNKNDGVRSFVLVFETKEDAQNAALVFKFSKGAAVQLDNVYMNGLNQASGVDEHPLKTSASYRGDNGGGVEIPLANKDGEVTMSNIVSGGSWYSPQLASEDFELVAGQKYKLSFDYKMEGQHNNSFQYIIQENAGSWHVFAGGPTTVECKNTGFNHYEMEFIADASISSVHLNYGFGNSDATGDMAFTFKNAKIDLVKQSANDNGENDNEDIDDSEFDLDKETEVKPTNPGSSQNSGSSGSSNSSGNSSQSGKMQTNTIINDTKTPLGNTAVASKTGIKKVNKQTSNTADKEVISNEETDNSEEIVEDERTETEISVTANNEHDAISDDSLEDENTPKAAVSDGSNSTFAIVAIIAVLVAAISAVGVSLIRKKH